jgi:hypothetical protein
MTCLPNSTTSTSPFSVQNSRIAIESTNGGIAGLSIYNARQYSYVEPLPKSMIVDVGISTYLQTESFDYFSLSLIQNIFHSNGKVSQQSSFKDLFGRMSAVQLNRHLKNLVIFLNLQGCGSTIHELVSFHPSSVQQKVDHMKVIAAQLSLIRVDQLTQVAKWAADGVVDARFYEHLWAHLKVEHLKPAQIANTNSGYRDTGFLSEIRKILVADKWTSTQSVTSIFEAGSIIQATLLKISAVASLTFALAVSGAGPFALIGLAAIPLTSMARRIYFSCLNAPPELYPLFDSRHLGSVANTFIGRGEVIDEVIATLANKKIRQYPLLIGEPGVGKSAIMLEIIRRFSANEIRGFEGKVAFFGSAAQITPENTQGPTHLQRVMDAILEYNENVILALDELAVIFKSGDETLIGHFKTVLSEMPGSLRYGIFAMTQQEYEKYIVNANDPTFIRRFKPIDVQSLVRQNLLQLLHLEAMAIAPTLRIEEEAINRVYELAEGKGHQNNARLLLNRVLNSAAKINSFHISYQNEEDKKAEIDAKKALIHKSANLGARETNRLLDQIDNREQELIPLSEQSRLQRTVREEFRNLQEKQLKVLSEKSALFKSIYQIVKELASSTNLSGQDILRSIGEPNSPYKERVNTLLNQAWKGRIPFEQTFKLMIFSHYYQLSSGAEFVENFARIFGLVNVIDRKFIEQVCDIQTPSSITATVCDSGDIEEEKKECQG